MFFLGAKSTIINHKAKSNISDLTVFTTCSVSTCRSVGKCTCGSIAALIRTFLYETDEKKTVINYLNKRYKTSIPPEHFHSQRHEAEV